MAYLTDEQLLRLGFATLGKHVLISDKASIYNPSKISIGSHVRIDDFCIISAGIGGIEIGNYIHIACHTSIIGAGNICISDYANVSSHVAIYSSSDDYSGEFMTNPMIPESLTGVTKLPVFLGRHAIVGAGSVILPGTTLSEGVALGALSLAKGEYDAFGIYAGRPAKLVRPRKRNIIDLEQKFRSCLS